MEDKAKYRSLRNFLGLGLAVAWIAYRWGELKQEEAAGLAAITNCEGFLKGISCGWQRGNVEGGFTGGVATAVLLSPLAFVVAHYIARWWVTNEERNAVAREAAAVAVAEQVQKEQSAKRLAMAEGDASKARQALDRGEFIHKLGAVSDYLDLLANETEPSRIANVRLGAAQALRDLTAKHSVDQLALMIAQDVGVRLSLEAVLVKLNASFGNSGEVRILEASLASAALAFNRTANAG